MHAGRAHAHMPGAACLGTSLPYHDICTCACMPKGHLLTCRGAACVGTGLSRPPRSWSWRTARMAQPILARRPAPRALLTRLSPKPYLGMQARFCSSCMAVAFDFLHSCEHCLRCTMMQWCHYGAHCRGVHYPCRMSRVPFTILDVHQTVRSCLLEVLWCWHCVRGFVRPGS